jgi:ribosomal protein L37AE/L43A
MLNDFLLTLIEQRKYTTEDRSWWQGVVVGMDLQNQLSESPWPPETSHDKVMHCPACGQPMCDHSSSWEWVCHRCDKVFDREVITLGHVGTVPLLLLKGLKGESAFVITAPLDSPNQKEGPE